MSNSENPKRIIIRYQARNNSAHSISPGRAFFNHSPHSNSSNKLDDSSDSTHFITLHDEDDGEEEEATKHDHDDDDDPFDSAKEADEEDNAIDHTTVEEDRQQQNSRLLPKAVVDAVFEDSVVEEVVALECRVTKRSSSSNGSNSNNNNRIELEAPIPIMETVTFPMDQFSQEFGRMNSFRSLLAFPGRVLNRHHSLPFFRFRLIAAGFLVVAILLFPSFLTGFLAGIYLSLVTFLFLCVSDPMPKQHSPLNGRLFSHQQQVLNQIAARNDAAARKAKGGREGAGIIYKGWMNILNEHYHPHTFHVNTIQTVLVRLDGCLLRISRPERAMLKHCFHVDPTLTEPEPRMKAQNIYDLTGAVVKLRPRRLARRRWFSRKYPICIRLGLDSVYGNADPEHVGQQGRKRKDGRVRKEEEDGSTPAEELERKAFIKGESLKEMPSEGSDDDDDEETTELSEEEGSPIRHSISEYSLDGRPRLPHRRHRRLHGKKRSLAGRYIFLFARSAREKERWFHMLRKACLKYHCSSKAGTDFTCANNEEEEQQDGSNWKRRVSFDSLDLRGLTSKSLLYSLQEFQFAKQLELLLLDQAQPPAQHRHPMGPIEPMDLGLSLWKKSTEPISDQQFVVLANLVATRLFYDFCRDRYWCEAVRNKIQTKLATIHLPYFIETLELSTFDLGTSIPKIVKVYRPAVDEWGIWCDFEVKYSGLIKLGLETRVNLMKLKSVSSESTSSEDANTPANNGQPPTPFTTSLLRATPSRYSDEEMPESPETSPDEEFGAKLKEFTSGNNNGTGNGNNSSGGSSQNVAQRKQKTGQRILSLVDRLAHSKYFREAAELKPVRKMMEEISSTRLMLNVEVTALEGTMTLNLPPPPSDRLWYGFRAPPQMSMRAIPQVGDRSVVYSTLSDWIENKLQLILEKNLVLPNMDDVVIPIMSGNQLLQGNLNR